MLRVFYNDKSNNCAGIICCTHVRVNYANKCITFNSSVDNSQRTLYYRRDVSDDTVTNWLLKLSSDRYALGNTIGLAESAYADASLLRGDTII